MPCNAMQCYVTPCSAVQCSPGSLQWICWNIQRYQSRGRSTLCGAQWGGDGGVQQCIPPPPQPPPLTDRDASGSPVSSTGPMPSYFTHRRSRRAPPPPEMAEQPGGGTAPSMGPGGGAGGVMGAFGGSWGERVRSARGLWVRRGRVPWAALDVPSGVPRGALSNANGGPGVSPMGVPGVFLDVPHWGPRGGSGRPPMGSHGCSQRGSHG